MGETFSSRAALLSGVKVSTHLGADAFRLHRLHFSETLGRPFRMELELVATGGDVAPEKMLGHGLTVTLPRPGGGERHFHGLVRHCTRRIGGSSPASHSLAIVPWIDLLDLGADDRVFQGKNPVAIVAQVCSDLGFSDSDAGGISGSHPPLDYCVQYGESHFAFVHRLMERYGFTYFVEHGQGRHTLKLCDSPEAHPPFPGGQPLPFVAGHDAATAVEHVYEWERRGAMQTGRHSTSDYDYQDPKTQLSASESTSASHPHGDIEWFSYPAGASSTEVVRSAAKLRSESASCRGVEVAGVAHATGIAVGYTFDLKDCPIKQENGRYLATAVELTLEPAGADARATPAADFASRCRFRAIPADTPYRPAVVTPVPRVPGVQSAIVVGPQGQDPKTPYTDSLGRIKVQFRWDRHGKHDERSSCWLRTPHQSAGNGYGHVWLPRIGCEVLVAFLDGDPDRPTIVGHVYNGQTTLPLDLPGEARVGIIKDDGGNYMKIDPTDGGQVMAMFSPTEKTSLKLGKT